MNSRTTIHYVGELCHTSCVRSVCRRWNAGAVSRCGSLLLCFECPQSRCNATCTCRSSKPEIMKNYRKLLNIVEYSCWILLLLITGEPNESAEINVIFVLTSAAWIILMTSLMIYGDEDAPALRMLKVMPCVSLFCAGARPLKKH